MFYAALDVSLRSVAICIIDHDGKICFERSVRSDVPDVLLCLAGFGQPIHQVGFEARALTQPISYGLTEAGYDVVCMEARQVAAALSAMRNKTDKHDARGIAQILRSGWYSRVHVKSIERDEPQGDAAQVHRPRQRDPRPVADLRRRSAFAACRGARDDRDRPCAQPCAPTDAGGTGDALGDLHRTRSAGEVGRARRHDLSALHDRAGRWSARTVGAHFGLTPRRFQSGETDNPGRISLAGDADVRATLYAAANAMLMRSITWSSLKAWGVRLRKTKGRRRAIVAVARKIAVVLHRMWADGTDFHLGSETAA